jgi:hypothetical protein
VGCLALAARNRKPEIRHQRFESERIADGL